MGVVVLRNVFEPGLWWSQSILAGDLLRPLGERVHEVGLVGVVHHSHSADGVRDSVDQVLNVLRSLWSLAQVEDLLDLCVLGEVVLQVVKVEEATRVGVVASLAALLLDDLAGHLGVSSVQHLSSEPENWSARSQGSLEHMGILHS